MKTMVSILFLYLLSFQLNAQDNVFVLVDVSRSVQQTELRHAKQLVKDVLTGHYSSSPFFSISGQVPKYNFIAGSHLSIMHFGDKRTTISNNVVQSISSKDELENWIEQYFRTNPTDDSTYLTLAKAKCADEAYKNSINEYTVVLVSDNVSDDFRGSITGYSNEEQALVNSLSTITNTFAGSLFTINSRAAFTVLFQRINLRGYGGSNDSDSDGVPDLIDRCPGTLNGQHVDQFGCPDTNPPTLMIELTSFKGGTILKPCKVNGDKFTISWTCKAAPKNTDYRIRLSPINNKGEKAVVSATKNNYFNFQSISDGKWQVSVSTNESSASTIIEVNKGDSSWVLWFLLLGVIGGGGYWYWKKLQEDKLKRLNALSNSENFTGGSTINTNSDTTGYF